MLFSGFPYGLDKSLFKVEYRHFLLKVAGIILVDFL